MNHLQQEYAFVEVYDERGQSFQLKKSHASSFKQESEIIPEIEDLDSNSSDNMMENRRIMTSTVATSIDLIDLKKSLCKQIDDSLLVFRRKLNQSLEKKFDVLEAKLADIQNDVEDLKTIVTEQRQTQIQTNSKNLPKPKLVPPLASLKRSFEDEKIVTLNKLKELYGCSFPLKTRKDFEEFDKTIVDGFYDDLKTHLLSAINTDKSLKITCSLMFKKLFSRDVLTSMTAQKKNNVKLLFKETKFFGCLKEAVREAFANIDVIEEKELLKAVGSVINNSIDWEGHRVKRQKSVKIE